MGRESAGERSLLLNHNLHSAYLSLVDPNFAELTRLQTARSSMVFPILLLANRYRAGAVKRPPLLTTDVVRTTGSLTLEPCRTAIGSPF